MKQLSLLMAMSLISIPSFALTNVSIKGFSFKYEDPKGEGVAQEFRLDDQQSSEPLKVLVDKEGKGLRLKTQGAIEEEFVLEAAPDMVLEAKKMNVNSFLVDFTNSIQMGLKQGEFENTKDSMRVEEVSLACQRNTTVEDLKLQALQGCLKQLDLKVKRYNSFSLAQALVNVEPKFLGNVGVDGLSLKVNDGKYFLVAGIRAQISGNVKSEGVASYDASKKMLTVKVAYFKFGFLNVTGKVFDELEKNESEKMIVHQPYIDFILD